MGEDAIKAASEARCFETRRRALNLLARREHAPSELAAKLRRRGYADEDIEVVCAALSEENLLSGQRYAQAVVAAQSGRGIGPVRIRAALAAAAIDDATVETALAEAEVDWIARARAVRKKRFGPCLPDDFPTQAKQMRFLQQRGFDADQLRAVFGG